MSLRIVDSYTPVDGEPAPLELQVYASPQNGETVFGLIAGTGYPAADGKSVTFLTIPFGTPVDDAFLKAVSLAKQHGIPCISIKDPDGLFPPEKRPQIGKLRGTHRIRNTPPLENGVWVADGGMGFEIKESDYVERGYRPSLDDLQWGSAVPGA